MRISGRAERGAFFRADRAGAFPEYAVGAVPAVDRRLRHVGRDPDLCAIDRPIAGGLPAFAA